MILPKKRFQVFAKLTQIVKLQALMSGGANHNYSRDIKHMLMKLDLVTNMLVSFRHTDQPHVVCWILLYVPPRLEQQNAAF